MSPSHILWGEKGEHRQGSSSSVLGLSHGMDFESVYHFIIVSYIFSKDFIYFFEKLKFCFVSYHTLLVD